MENVIEVKNASVFRGTTRVVSDISFALKEGEVLLLLGKNGAGKSSLAYALMGALPLVTSHESRVMSFLGEDISNLPAHERARRGMFLAHQEPPVIAGVAVVDVLRAAVEAKEPLTFTVPQFYTALRQALSFLNLNEAFVKREMNAQFSGGEKKRVELLSLLLLKPKFAILDEIDAGMDEEVRGSLLRVIGALRAEGTAFLIISHHAEVFSTLPHFQTLNLLPQTL